MAYRVKIKKRISTVLLVIVTIAGSGWGNPAWAAFITSGSSQWSKVGTTINYGAGNVGIGITDPLSLLHVYSTGVASQRIEAAGWSTLNFGAQANATGTKNYQLTARNNAFYLARTTDDWIGTGSYLMHFNSNGNVGFGGITDAAYKLDVSGSIRSTSGAYFATTAGYVGIGTTTPTTTLHVTSNLNDTVNVGGRYIGGLDLTPVRPDHAVPLGYLQGNYVPDDPSVPGGIGSGTTGQTLRHNGTGWVANSILYNNGANIGIGTISPGAKLAISGGEGAFNAPNFGSTNLGAINILNTTSDRRNAITFSAAGLSNAQAGIYVHQDNSAGTHMYLATTNSYATGPQARLTIRHDGNIGIGTTLPGSILHIAGAVAGTSIATADTRLLTLQKTGTPVASEKLGIIFKGESSEDLAGIFTDMAANSNSNSHLLFATRNLAGTLGERLRINSEGNVGIGTSSPLSKLDVQSNTGKQANFFGYSEIATGNKAYNFNGAIFLGNSSAYQGIIDYYGAGVPAILTIKNTYNVQTANSKINFDIGVNNIMSLQGSGNVGISSTTPNSKLAVMGASGIGIGVAGASGDAVNVGGGQVGGLASTPVRDDHAISWKFATTTFFMHAGNSFGVNTSLGTNDNFRLDLETNSVARMTLANNGNIGIGVTNPQAKLEIASSSNVEGLRIISSNYSPFVIRNASNTADIFRIDQNGNITGGIGNSTAWTRNNTTNQLYVSNINDKVGIGTTNPKEKLTVNGRADFSNNTLTGVILWPNVYDDVDERRVRNVIGNMDDLLAYAVDRGYTVTANRAPYSGTLKCLFWPPGSDTGCYKPMWSAVSAANPVEITISGLPNLSVDRMIIVPHTRNAMPINYKIETYDIYNAGWVTKKDVTGETSPYIKYTGLGYQEGVQQIRITVTDAGDSDYNDTLGLANIVVTSRYQTGRFTGYALSASGDTSYGQTTFTQNTLFPSGGIWNTAGNVGIGITNPSYKLQVVGDINIPASQAYRVNTNPVIAQDSSNIRVGFLNAATNPTNYSWLQFTTDSTIKFFTGSTEKMRLSSAGGVSLGNSYIGNDAGAGSMIMSGNLGIGTTAPDAKLRVVSGDNAMAAYIQNTSGSANAGGLAIKTTEGNNPGADSFRVQAWGDRVMIRTGNGSQRPYVTMVETFGNVGIGTTTPVATLSVQSTSDPAIRVNSRQIAGLPAVQTEDDQAVSRKYLHDNFNSFWAGSSTSHIYNMNSGNVGIGITNPWAKLDIITTDNTPGLRLRNDTTGGIFPMRFDNMIGSTGNSLRQFVTSGNADTNVGNPVLGWITSYAIEYSGTYAAAVTPAQFKGWQWMVYDGSAYSSRMNLSSGGNLGIGTTNPGVKFQVTGNLALNDTTTQSLLRLDRPYNGGVSWAQGVDLAVGRGNTYPSTQLRFILDNGTNNPSSPQAMIMALDSGGNVGLGTISPQARLEISAGSEPAVNVNGRRIVGLPLATTEDSEAVSRKYLHDNFTSTTTVAAGSFWGGSLTGNIYNANSGNVGIGTSTPSKKLTILTPDSDVGLRLVGPGGETYDIGETAGNEMKISSQTYINLNAYHRATSDIQIRNADILMRQPTYFTVGNVGIGTTTPGAKLHVTGSISDTVGISVFTNNTTDNAYSVNFNRASTNVQNAFTWQTNGSSRWFLGQDNDATDDILLYAWGGNRFIMKSFYATGDIAFGAANTATPSLYVKYTGNVGIGTSNPGADRLRVEGDGPVLRINAINSSSNLAQLKLSWSGSDTHGLTLGYNAQSAQSFIDAVYPKVTGTVYGDIRFRRNVASIMMDTMIIKGDTGYVGIGTTNPGYKLTVSSSTAQVINVAGGHISGLDFTPLANDYATSKQYVDSLFTNAFQQGGNSFATTTILGTNDNYRLDLETNNVVRMTVANNGNIGIGTTNSQAKLEIASTTNIEGLRIISSNYSPFVIRNSANTADIFRIDQYGNITGGIGNSTAWTRSTTTNQLYVTNTSDNVGIGTTNPGEKLTIAAAADISTEVLKIRNNSLTEKAVVALDSGGIPYISFNTSGYLRTTANANQIYLASTGNVGIGTSSPTSKLEVSGPSAIVTLNDTVSTSASYFNYNDQGVQKAFTGLVNANAWGGISGSLDGDMFITTHSANNANGRIVLATKQNVLNGMTINSNGNVGIGTANAITKLQIGNNWSAGGSGTIYLGSSGFALSNLLPQQIITTNSTDVVPGRNIGLALHNSTATAGAYAPLLVFSTMETGGSTYNGAISAIGARTVTGSGAGGSYIDGEMMFYTAPTLGSGLLERMRITEAGNIGFGTTNPNRQLTFGQSSADAIQIRRLTTSQGNPAVGTGISWTWNGGSPYDNETWAAIRVIMPGSTNSHMTFSTTPSGGGAAGLAERMRIQDNGNVGINTTSPVAKLSVYSTSSPAIYSGGRHIAGLDLTPINPDHAVPLGYLQDNYTPLWSGTKNGSIWNGTLGAGNVGIGTNTPGSKLTLAGGDFEMDHNTSVKVNNANLTSTILFGNYTGTTTSFTYGTSTNNRVLSLAVEGDVKADRLCIEEDCKDNWAGIVSAGNAVFVGLTATAYNGSNNSNPGYEVAFSACETDYTGSHVCTPDDMLNNIKNGATSPAANAWIFSGPPGYTASANDCNGRRAAAASDLGAYWEGSSASFPKGRGLLMSCNQTIKIACCR